MWTEEQQLAIDKQNSNILVSASAGSGKTAVLVERVINKVIKYKIDIDKILVVTFTNAAAAELKERLMLAIYKALNTNPKDSFLKRQLTYINRASITTIHSFCLDIIRANFQELDIDPNFKICDETESNILKSKAILKVLEEEYALSNEDDERKNKLFNLLELFGSKDDTLIEYILKIYSYIQSFAFEFEWLNKAIEKYNIKECNDLYETDYGRDIYNSVVQEIEIIIKKTEEIIEQITGYEDFVKYVQILQEDVSLLKLCLLNGEKNWDKLCESISNISFSRAPAYKGDNLKLKEMVTSFRTEVLKKSVEKCKKNVYEKTKQIIKEQQVAYQYISYIYDFIVKFDKIYKELKKGKNYVDFNDIEHMSLNLLVYKNEDEKYEYTQIANNLREKFAEVYTDEYQDISFIQEAILSAVSNQNNRFMVGDIKQSIYKFRQAMPDIFNQKYDNYNLIKNVEEKVDDAKIVLAKNFRSRREVLDSINYIFERIMSQEMGDCNYSNLETLKFGATSYDENKLQDYSTSINIIDLKQEESNEIEDEIDKYISELKNFEIEAILIAKKIEEIVKENKTYNLKTNVVSNTKYKDIVILLRSIKDKGKILEETLKKFNIPVFCDASSSLFDSDEIRLCMSLLQIIDNPYQDIHIISVLYSIIGKFTLDELVYIRSIDKKSRVYDNLINLQEVLNLKKETNKFEDTLKEKINSFINVLNELREYSKVYPISKLLIKIFNDTNIYRQYILDNNSNQRQANLNILVDLALKCENQNIQTLSDYIMYIDNLKDKVDTSTSSAKIIGENEDVVRIMTIHKSKGLEFPYVIVCDTMKKYNMLDTTSIVTLHHDLGIGINVVNEKFKITYPSVIKQAIRNRLIKETKAEELRMLYVALTRAKEKLYIFATVNDYEKLNNKQIPIYNGSKIDPYIILNNNTYFENINMALKQYKEELKLFDINVIKIKDVKELNIINENNQVNRLVNIKEKFDKKSEYDKSKVKENVEKYKEIIDFKYKYQEDVTTPSRVSVSSLKREAAEENIFELSFEEENLNIAEKYNLNEVFDSDDKEYNSVRKGTLVHFVLEHLDMKMNYDIVKLKETINNLVNQGLIEKRDLKYINTYKIFKFLNSYLGKEIYKSSNVNKEQEFVLKNTRFSKSVIQGIIDLYYINQNENIVLIDFKTDRLKEEQEYINKYKKQLEIYKEALEKIIGKKVENTYIYSFYLDKEIEVKYE